MRQSDLFEPILRALEAGEEVPVQEIYESLEASADSDPHAVAAVGRDRQPVNLFQRTVRWAYQSLKHKKMVASRRRGYWYITGTGRTHLTAIQEGQAMIAFRTDLGICLWADATAAGEFDGELSLICVSPPYPLLRKRSYGNPSADEYVDWLLQKLTPAVKLLKPGGSLVLNLGQDVFEPGRPVRSTYLEQTVLALTQECGLRLHDRIPMVNRTREPGPTPWALRAPYLLRQIWEPIYWFSNSDKPSANNRSILRAYTKSMEALVEKGGETRSFRGPSGSRRRVGSFGADNGGALPTNVFEVIHSTPSSDTSYGEYAKACRAEQLPIHPARMPLEAARTLIRFLTEPGDWVADVMAGSLTTAYAAELLDRRWLAVDLMREFLQGGATRFRSRPGFAFEPSFLEACTLGQQRLF